MKMRKIKVAVLAVGLMALPLSAPAVTPKVQAGGPLSNSAGQVICTFNFIFRSGGQNYAGTAAHCADNDRPQLVVGDRVRAGDPDSPLGRFVTPQEIGTVVASEGDIDFALIKLDAGVTAIASVRGWGGPTGYTVARAGDLVYFTGYGIGPGEVVATRHRAGVMVSSDGSEQNADIPASLGDSGGPIINGQGQAVGTIARLSVSGATSERGPTLNAILARLATRGFNLSLVTGGPFSAIPSLSS